MLRYEENPSLTAEQIAELRKSVGWNEMTEEYRKTIGHSYFYLACFDNDTLIGFIDVLSDKVADAYIRDLMVHPTYQHQGIGMKLLTTAIAKINQDSIYAINVLFDENLKPFYEKAGFTTIAGGVIITR